MIEVFKTTIENSKQANVVKQLLLMANPTLEINFDLDDCDRILRINNNEKTVDVSAVLKIFHEKGIQIEVLPD
jgi:N12 class adenine-specific DNA methylase